MKMTTMTLTKKRQTVFPLDWCKRQGLEQGGPLNVFDLGESGLLIRPVKAPPPEEIK
jgi:bifunctional DNA-binding transcriptional regulator/antitoxin component of YhaV-PrlF toxin-antitoxin module